MLKIRGRLAVSAAAGALLLGAGVAGLSGGAAASTAPSPSETLTFSQTCLLQRIGGQFTRCDNLTGAGVRAPAYIPQVQRMGLSDFR
ncbi:hypothetical protein [Mycetocola zhadangensis]|nr:hypothetical protein [Mycetocola zhadangensis]